jgi:bacteriocin-like protein
MRELSTNELDAVIGGSVSYPAVYIQELSGNLTSIPGVSTSTGQQPYVYPKQENNQQVGQPGRNRTGLLLISI